MNSALLWKKGGKESPNGLAPKVTAHSNPNDERDHALTSSRALRDGIRPCQEGYKARIHHVPRATSAFFPIGEAFEYTNSLVVDPFRVSKDHPRAYCIVSGNVDRIHDRAVHIANNIMGP